MEGNNKRGNAINFAAFICFLLALGLLILLRLFKVEEFVEWYAKYLQALESFEIKIQQEGSTWISVLIILANFAIKAVIPWFPIPCICVASGVLFKWYQALLINAFGMAILFIIRFFWGKRFGGGNAEKLLERYDKAHRFIDRSKLGSLAVLFLLRLVPGVPVNLVSSLYGTTDIKPVKYILISLAGFSYKLFTYTTIGRNVFDPASAPFIVPLILLLIFSGIVLLILSGALSLARLRAKIVKLNKERSIFLNDIFDKKDD